MAVSDTEVDRIAREMIRQHGGGAARAAAERLNDRIDQGDWSGRDVWARIVHAVHQIQGVAIAGDLSPRRPAATARPAATQ